MSFFLSANAEYQAKRIAQLLLPHTNISATKDGSVLANFNGHMYQYRLNELGQLYVVGDANLTPTTNIIEIR